MLKLIQPVVYTDAEKAEIAALMGNNAFDGNDLWKQASKELKNHISRHTIFYQEARCPYCECRLLEKREIEHVANKGKHRIFTFEPLNLLTACGRCNSTEVKGQKETIVGQEVLPYQNNTFNIVHPYLCPNPDAEIVFQDEDRVDFDLTRCTPLGINTIEFFNWRSRAARMAREREIGRRGRPDDLLDLVEEICTYK